MLIFAMRGYERNPGSLPAAPVGSAAEHEVIKLSAARALQLALTRPGQSTFLQLGRRFPRVSPGGRT
jgi:hypothetical protein